MTKKKRKTDKNNRKINKYFISKKARRKKERKKTVQLTYSQLSSTLMLLHYLETRHKRSSTVKFGSRRWIGDRPRPNNPCFLILIETFLLATLIDKEERIFLLSPSPPPHTQFLDTIFFFNPPRFPSNPVRLFLNGHRYKAPSSIFQLFHLFHDDKAPRCQLRP